MALSLTSKQMTPLVMFWEGGDDQSQEQVPPMKITILFLPLSFTLAPRPELPTASYLNFCKPWSNVTKQKANVQLTFGEPQSHSSPGSTNLLPQKGALYASSGLGILRRQFPPLFKVNFSKSSALQLLKFLEPL